MKKLILLLLLISSPCFATTYYLDADAVGTGDGLSMANAFTSFANVTATTGDTLYISGGSTSKLYTLTTTFALKSDMTIKVSPDTGHDGVVIIDGGDTLNPLFSIGARDSVLVDGEINGEKHIRFQNWGEATTSGVIFYALNGYGNNVTNSTFRYLEFVNDDYTCEGIDCADTQLKGCVQMSRLQGGSIIEHNYFEGCVRKTMAVGNANATTSYEDSFIQYNEMKGFKDTINRGGPDAISGGQGSTIRYNTFYHVEAVNAEYNPAHEAEDGIQLTGSYSKVYGNVVYDISSASCRTDASDMTNVLIYNNLFYFNKDYTGSGGYELPRGIQFDIINTADEIHVYNNTIVGHKILGIDVSTRVQTTLADIKVKNNILIDAPMSSDTDGSGLAIDIDYNLILESDYSEDTSAPNQTNNPFDSQKSFDFVSYTLGSPTNDFRLANSDNMAIDSGADLSAYFTDDIDGNLRTVPYDLGTYIYGASETCSTEPSLCGDQSTCETAGWNWCDGVCQSASCDFLHGIFKFSESQPYPVVLQ